MSTHIRNKNNQRIKKSVDFESSNNETEYPHADNE